MTIETATLCPQCSTQVEIGGGKEGTRYFVNADGSEHVCKKAEMPEIFRSASCDDERCSMCGEPADMKIGEEIMHDDPQSGRHNRTAYVCRKHGRWVLFGEPPALADEMPEDVRIVLDDAREALARSRHCAIDYEVALAWLADDRERLLAENEALHGAVRQLRIVNALAGEPMPYVPTQLTTHTGPEDTNASR